MDAMPVSAYPLRQSIHAHVFSKDGMVALYHALSMEVVYADAWLRPLFDVFKEPHTSALALASVPLRDRQEGQEFLWRLEELGLLVPQGKREEGLREGLSTHASVDLRIMYILPTDRCNLQCSYCYIENSFPLGYSFTSMTPETLRRGVDLFFSKSVAQSSDPRTIIFYGGEPLLCEDTVLGGFDYIRGHPLGGNTDIHLITNGTALSSRSIDAILHYGVRVAVSIDGPARVHDSARVNVAGRGSYAQAEDAVRRLHEAGVIELGLSITVGAHNVKGLRDHVEYLLDSLPGIGGIGFNLLLDLPSGSNPLAVDPLFATKQVLDAFEMLRQRGIYEDRIMRKLVPFVQREFHLKDCGAIGNQFILAPDGSIGPCQAFLSSHQFFTHHVSETSIDFDDDPVFDEWSRRMPVLMSECQGCEAIAVCGGGCPYEAFLRTGSIWGLDETMCVHNRAFLEWAVWDAFQSTQSP